MHQKQHSVYGIFESFYYFFTGICFAFFRILLVPLHVHIMSPIMLYLQLGWIFRYFCVSSGTNSSLLKPTVKMSKPLISSHMVIAVLMNFHYEHSFLNFILSIHVQSIKKHFNAPSPKDKQLCHKIHGLWWFQVSKVPTSIVLGERRCREAG